MSEISTDSRGTSDVVESEVGDILVELEEEGEGLSDSSCKRVNRRGEEVKQFSYLASSRAPGNVPRVVENMYVEGQRREEVGGGKEEPARDGGGR